ncbi:hypothetical protein TREMEDRAFT_58914 [Tremella mesenterica DSM 1558]|uniref:uncharacterized protein n=1 Tax=Tremella mesenterica (strain ATCC 24925 / CBS 8224 / DSM 1558 / NBRC 9311 / NRRL Y-6157 / RJB 2259-6 / UBC 559-6) TaxID=578456 RepID=UPI0003F4A25E|nr:uncharacterized protein TREMEDRAFT_58914 [Tremella mesenterica DSM 1558]EIW72747.1 hypothetical protein TREMEDRAFT_58914 [Tremella mesenterica DSM 1558]
MRSTSRSTSQSPLNPPRTPPPTSGRVQDQREFIVVGLESDWILDSISSEVLQQAVALAIALVESPAGLSATNTILSAPPAPSPGPTDPLPPPPPLSPPQPIHPTLRAWLSANRCQICVDESIIDYGMSTFDRHLVHLAAVIAHELQHVIMFFRDRTASAPPTIHDGCREHMRATSVGLVGESGCYWEKMTLGGELIGVLKSAETRRFLNEIDFLILQEYHPIEQYGPVNLSAIAQLAGLLHGWQNCIPIRVRANLLTPGLNTQLRLRDSQPSGTGPYRHPPRRAILGIFPQTNPRTCRKTMRTKEVLPLTNDANTDQK